MLLRVLRASPSHHHTLFLQGLWRRVPITRRYHTTKAPSRPPASPSTQPKQTEEEPQSKRTGRRVAIFMGAVLVLCESWVLRIHMRRDEEWRAYLKEVRGKFPPVYKLLAFGQEFRIMEEEQRRRDRVDESTVAESGTGTDVEDVDIKEEGIEEVDIKEEDIKEVDIKEEGIEEVDIKEEGIKEEGIKEVDIKEEDNKEVDIKEEDIKEVDIKEEDIKETDIKETDIKEEDIKETDIKETDIKEEDIKETDIKETDIKETDIKETDIKEEDIKETDIKETDIKEEDIKETDIKETDIKEEDIKETDIKETDIKEEDIKEEDIEETDIKEEDIKETDIKEMKTPERVAELKLWIKELLNEKQQDHEAFQRALEAKEDVFQKALEEERRALQEELQVEKDRMTEDLQTEKRAFVRRMEEERNATREEIESTWKREFDEERSFRRAALNRLSMRVMALDRVLSHYSMDIVTTQRLHQMSMVLFQFLDAMERMRPLTDLVEGLREVGLRDPLLAAAVESIPGHLIDAGVPTRSMLLESLQETAQEGRVQAFMNSSNSMWAHVLASVTAFLRVQEKGLVEGDHPWATLARAEFYMKRGDVSQALHEIETLKGRARSAMEGWVVHARERLIVEQAAQLVEAHVITSIASLL